MDNDRIKKKAEELAERLKRSGSQSLKSQGQELADRIKNQAGEVSSKNPPSGDSLDQAKNKVREELGGAKKTSSNASSPLTGERSRSKDERSPDDDDLDDLDLEEEVA
jgi:hypothetical protein